MNAYETLVIILSVTLAVFLILSIVAAVLLIQILRKGQAIADRLDRASINVAETANEWAEKAAPASIMLNLSQAFRNFTQRNK